MINLIYSPQRADVKAEYIVNNDILTVKLNGMETFNFTGLGEGMAEEIIAEHIPDNPIISANKVGDTINITVIQFYGEDEKHLFEVTENE